jgi:hypothetical protein
MVFLAMWLTIVTLAYCLLFSIGLLLRLGILLGIIILVVGLIL